ncbi:MAG: NAD(P)-binding protein, partial [Rikenellaceae bacterium]|nr:NAD(P)-binding protein [Rikenellaceae bacterium]
MMEKQYDYLIVGAGLFGAVFARQAADAGRRALVIDKREHPGGNLRCERIDGIEVHAYGAHIFHTDNTGVWEYVNRLVPFNRYTNSPLANYRGEVYNLPFNMNTFNRLWGIGDPARARLKLEEERGEYSGIEEPANLEEQALKLCGRTIYEYFIKGYTEKQWGRDARELPAFIIRRIPFRFTFDNNYFNDPYQGIPCGGGYNGLIEALLSGVDVLTGADFFEERPRWESLARRIVFTGCIDEFFGHRFGRLEYRSLRF